MHVVVCVSVCVFMCVIYFIVFVMCICLREWVPCVCKCWQRPVGGAEYLGAGVKL